MDSLEKEARQALADSADYIDEHGWTQGRTLRPTGEVCTRGAILYAVGINPLTEIAYNLRALNIFDLAEKFLVKSIGLQNRAYIPHWNDDELRTQEQVVKELRTAAGQ